MFYFLFKQSEILSMKSFILYIRSKRLEQDADRTRYYQGVQTKGRSHIGNSYFRDLGSSHTNNALHSLPHRRFDKGLQAQLPCGVVLLHGLSKGIEADGDERL